MHFSLSLWGEELLFLHAPSLLFSGLRALRADLQVGREEFTAIFDELCPPRPVLTRFYLQHRTSTPRGASRGVSVFWTCSRREKVETRRFVTPPPLIFFKPQCCCFVFVFVFFNGGLSVFESGGFVNWWYISFCIFCTRGKEPNVTNTKPDQWKMVLTREMQYTCVSVGNVVCVMLCITSG